MVRRGEGGNYGNAVRNSDILLTAIDEECDYVHEVLSSRKWENPFGIDFLKKMISVILKILEILDRP